MIMPKKKTKIFGTTDFQYEQRPLFLMLTLTPGPIVV